MADPFKLDFVIIGAQKSGTTSLFNYLSSHPAVYMPGQKELRFFSHFFERGLDWYRAQYFANAPIDSVKGEASPHYMYSQGVPERIASAFPDIKLIAILRNPVNRAYSHYQMTVRRKLEKRSFFDAVQEAAKSLSNHEALDEDFDYVSLGEYGHILAQFFKVFKPEQIFVGFLEDLEAEPEAFVRRIYQFIEVDSTFVPPNIKTKFHQGGRQRFPGLKNKVSRKLHQLKKNRWLGRFLTEDRIASILFRIETEWNVKKGYETDMAVVARSFLVEHYRDDVKFLENLIHQTVPWKEFHA